LVEGVFVLMDTTSPEESRAGLAVGLSRQNSFHRMEWVLLEALGVGDMATAGLGLVGLALASGLALPRGLAARREAAVGGAVGALLAWRVLVTLSVVPWIGFMFVFEPLEYTRWTRVVAALLYIAFNMYLLQLLVAAYSTAKREGRIMEEEFCLGIGEDSRESFMAGSRSRSGLGESNVLFSCLPLDLAVASYCACLCVGCLYGLLNLLETGLSSGGWALFMHPANVASSTFWLEIFGFLTSVVVAAFAAGAVLAHWRLEREAGEYEEDLFVQRPARKKCASLLLLFYIASTLRFALWVPVTGMALATRDICGVYVQGLAVVSLNGHSNPLASPDRCTVAEWGVLASAIILIALDAYLISGVYQLWQKYRLDSMVSKKQAYNPNDAPLFGQAATFGHSGS